MKQEYIDKLNNMIKMLEEKHIDSYFNISKDELKEYINLILKNYKLEDDYDFYYISNMILKKMFNIYDSHTLIYYKDTKCNVPIRLKYIDKKLYIIKTDEENKDILYGQILKINDIDIEELIIELEQMTSYSTNGFLEFKIETTFYNESKMKALPSIDNDIEEFKYSILKDGQVTEVKLKKSEVKFGNNINYTYNIIDGIMVINYTSCIEEYKGQMIEFVDKIKEESLKNGITKYVVNIRENMGGNSEIIEPLIKFLKDKEVITLIDKEVFSGGRFALLNLIKIGSKTVGTGIGTSINCFGNAPTNDFGNFLLPISNKYFIYDNTVLVGLKKEDFDQKKSMLKEKNYFIPIIYEPDYYVENTLEDYINGRDSQLEFAINILKNEKINQR